VAKLPVISGRDLVQIFQKIGFRVIRQKGSHVSMRKDNYKTVIPLHDELAKGTLLGILKQCGLTKDDLIDLLKKK
jgi:predicted RNA binding protein YcfA (HicA-like mRNA interferase family)